MTMRAMTMTMVMAMALGACGGAQNGATSSAPTTTSTTTTATAAPSSTTAPAMGAPDVHFVHVAHEHEALPTNGVHVTISPDALFVESTSVATLPFAHATAGELAIPPLATAIASAKAMDAILSVDARATYRSVMEVLYTLGQHEIARYHFVVIHGSTPRSIDVTPAKTMSLQDPPAAKSDLSVIVTHDGFSLKGRGGNVKTGCTETGPGLAIVNGPSGYDFAALDQCRANLAKTGGFSDSMVVTANPSTDFETVVRTIDTLRESFPRVSFGVSK